MIKRWTEEEEQQLARMWPTATVTELQEAFPTRSSTALRVLINRIRQKYNIPLRRSQRYGKPEKGGAR